MRSKLIVSLAVYGRDVVWWLEQEQVQVQVQVQVTRTGYCNRAVDRVHEKARNENAVHLLMRRGCLVMCRRS